MSILILGGDGPARSKWEQVARDMLPENSYRFAGHINPDDVGDFLSEIDCFVNVIDANGAEYVWFWVNYDLPSGPDNYTENLMFCLNST